MELADLSTWLPASGLGAFGMVGLLYVALAREALLTGASHRRELDSKDASHTLTIGLIGKELEEIRGDRDHYRDAAKAERARADAISERMTSNVVPLIQGTNKLLEAFTELGKGA